MRLRRLPARRSRCCSSRLPCLLANHGFVSRRRDRDRTARPLPGATVTISGPQMPLGRTTTTLSDGAFQFFSLIPGTYQLRAELAGLGAFTQEVVVALTKDTEVRTRAAGDRRGGGDGHARPRPSSTPRRRTSPSSRRGKRSRSCLWLAPSPGPSSSRPASSTRACRSPTRTSA